MGQDGQPTLAGHQRLSLRGATQAVKRWTVAVGYALWRLGEGHAECHGALPLAPMWLQVPRQCGLPAVHPGLRGWAGRGLALWLDFGPLAHPASCRACAQALGLDTEATLLWTGLSPVALPETLAWACALPQIACVVLDARDGETWAAHAISGPAFRLRWARQSRGWARLVVVCHRLPEGGADLPDKGPKLDRLRGIA